MDVKDHKGGRDIDGLIKSAQQLRMPDVESVIKQDEGEEAAGALSGEKSSVEMELNKPSESDLLEKMQHHPSSSSSAALTALIALTCGPYARRSPPPG